MMDGSGGMFFGGGFMWIFWLLLVIVVIVAAVKAMMAGNAPRGGRQKDSALSILEKRYARGEIDREVYQEKRRELED